jgi:hypothetical protein
LTLTDRLAIRIYVSTAGRTITLHTENGHLCQVITTFTTGLSALNGLTSQVQFFAVGTSGTNFNIASATDTHTFNLPTASATNRGALASADWSTFNNKQNQLNGTGFVKASGTTITYDNSTYQVTSEKAQPNGYASLDSNGKVPLVQINDALIGNVNFQGLWNAATNTPTLANPPASGTKGYYYIVSTAGTFAGISFEVGDWIISNGTAWGKVDNTDAVSSVFGRTGNVTASNGDYNTSQVTENTNLYYTEARVNANANVAANTAARHNAVTLGTANGLSLSTQQLSLGLASAGVTGALSGTDWSTFNGKANANGSNATGTWAISITGDAGSVDGIDSSRIVFGDNSTATTSIGEASIQTALKSGFYTVSDNGLGHIPTATSVNFLMHTAFVGIGNLAGIDLLTNDSTTSELYYRNATGGGKGPWRTILHSANFNSYAPTLLGVGASGTWSIAINGNAATANTWTNARTITIGNTGKSVNGSANVAWSLSEIGAYAATNPSAFIALTALSGTAPIQYNNTTGAISITQASGSTNGFLSSTDWNTFNNKTSNVGTVTSVAALTLGTSGTDLSSTVANGTTTPVITLNVPTASATNRGALSAADWTTFNSKENAITAGTTAQYYRGDKTFQTLNTAAVPESGNLYYTEARVNANTNVAANTAARHNAVTLGTANGLSLSTQQLSLGLASSSANGALSSTDWTTFNNKQNALTNPVTGTGTTNYLPKFTGASTIGNSSLFDGGGFGGFNNTGIGSRTFVINAASGRPLAFEVVEFANVHSIYVRPNNSGFNLISGNYISGGTYLPLSLSGRENNADLVLQTSGNVTIGSTTDAGFKLDVAGSVRTRNTIIDGANNGNVAKLNWTRTDFSWSINNETNLRFYVSSGNTLSPSTQVLELATSGAATFSSSVTAASLTISGNARFYAAGNWMQFQENLLTSLNNDGAHIRSVVSVQDAPTYSWAGDTDTGMFTPSANTIGFTAAGTERMRITSGGNVAVGTSTDYGYKFVANGEISSVTPSGTKAIVSIFQVGWNKWNFQMPANNIDLQIDENGSPRMTVKSGGNVGIGTTSPSEKLHLYANASSVELRMENSTISSYIRSQTDNLNFYVNGGERLRITSGGNVLIGTTTDIGQRLQVSGGYITQIDGGVRTFLGYDGSGSLVGTTTNQYFRFITNDTERMRITSGGNVGIGTASPVYKLQVNGDTAFLSTSGSLLSIITQGSEGKGRLYLYDGGSATIGLQTNGASYFNGGNVGIGTASPNFGLDLLSNNSARFKGSSNYMTLFLDNSSSSGGGGAYFLQNGTIGGGIGSSGWWLGDTSNDLLLVSTSGRNIRFLTNDVSPAKMTITSGGNVLIGTTSGNGARLQVHDGFATFASFIRVSGSASDIYPGAGQIILEGLTNSSSALTTSAGGDVGLRFDHRGVSNNGYWVWANGTNAGNERMRITSVGEVQLKQSSNSAQNSVIFNTTIQNAMTLNSSGNLILNGTTGSSRITCYGDGYFSGGIQTGNPYGSTSANWLLGRFLTETTSANGSIRVQIGSKYYNIAAEDLGTVPT